MTNFTFKAQKLILLLLIYLIVCGYKYFKEAKPDRTVYLHSIRVFIINFIARGIDDHGLPAILFTPQPCLF